MPHHARIWTPRRAVAAAALLLLAGCAAPPPHPAQAPAPPPATEGPQGSVRALLREAASAPAGEAAALRLQAARLLWEAGRTGEAMALLTATDLDAAPPAVALEARLLLAEEALGRGRPAEALAHLPEQAPLAPPRVQARLYRQRARAHAALGRAFEAARARIALDSFIEDRQAQLDNQRAILQQLTTLGDDALAALEGEAGPPVDGWLALARIAARPRIRSAFDAALAAWRARFPDHPARLELIEGIAARMRIEPLRPRTVALLLPLSGRLAAAGRAVRDGFLAAYLATPAAERPRLLLFDSAAADPVPLVDQAAAAGAEVAVGPLAKPSVTALATRLELPLTVLALNYADADIPPPPQLFQFGLLPEDEAAQAAERAWADGWTRALALVPQGSWGERMLAAFRARWEALGGELLEEARFDPAASDHRPVLRRLLDLDESEARRRELERLLGVRLRFEPRRRGDAELLFLAADPRAGRLMLPQLRFLRAGDIPVYATSRLFAGVVDPRADRDLDGVRFADLPWLLAPDARGRALRTELERLFPQGIAVYGRLYALGYDAWSLVPLLEWLARVEDSRHDGLTGILAPDSARRIHRRLYWARFEGGRPRPIGWTPVPTAEAQGQEAPQP